MEAVFLTAGFIYLGFNGLLNLTCSHIWYFNVSIVSYLHRLSICTNFATIVSVKKENDDKNKLFQENYSFSGEGKIRHMWSSTFSN